MRLETTIHRIGGDDFPDSNRQWGPAQLDVALSAIESREISAASGRGWLMQRFEGWEPVDEEWLSCRIHLSHIDGTPLGVRPALLYAEPYDVPTYTTFRPRWAPFGTFSVGLRMIER